MSRHLQNLGDLLQNIQKQDMDVEAGYEHIMHALEQQKTQKEALPELEPKEVEQNDDLLYQVALNYLKQVFADLIHIKVDQISPKINLEEYGMDSVVIMEMNEALEKKFENLPKTLFFEYQNLQELAEYLKENYKEVLDEMVESGAIKAVAVREYAVKSVQKKKSQIVKAVGQNRFFNIETKKETAAKEEMNEGDMDIAIIGMNGSFPNANDLEQFWDNLQRGMDCITTIPKERWNHSRYYDARKGISGKVYSKWGGFMEEYQCFDPYFFQMTPKDAELLDPQERIFLQCVHGAIEDAGYCKDSLWNSKTGVFAGVMYGHYQLYGAQETLQGNAMSLSSSYASIANRVSYFYNFHGPSIAMDTMCSSSLSALYLACESLYRKDCTTAIVGGVNLTIHPDKYLFLCGQHFASSEGKCRAFGANGDGYVPGEGVGAILIKPYRKAIEDKDYIYGVIKGTAINHGGKTNGYTVPNPNAQADVIRTALKRGNINPRNISYVEAHGTGTSLGDPIEISGLSKAYREYTKDNQYCAIGSVKTNVGHLESAAGIVSIIKVLQQMQHKQLVPSLHSEILNPNIDFDHSPFYVQRTLDEWKQPEILEDGKIKKQKRCAAISSFGAGGTNVHVIVEEEEREEIQIHEQKQEVTLEPSIFVLSAKNEERLKEYCKKYIRFIEKHTVIRAKIATKKWDGQKDEETYASVIDIIVQLSGIVKEEISHTDVLEELGMTNRECLLLREQIENKFDLHHLPHIFRENMMVKEVIESLKSCIGNKERREECKEQEGKPVYTIAFADLIHTVQNGREHMEERLAAVVFTLDELKDKLISFVEGEEQIAGLYTGNCKNSHGIKEIFSEEEEGVLLVELLYQHRKFEKICKMWIDGVGISWQQLQCSDKGRRIPIPTYPFEKKSYWYTKKKDVFTIGKNCLTPVIDTNESMLEYQCYKKMFSREDFYLREHIINGHMILPGVVYLEMFYQAGMLATKSYRIGSLTDINWMTALYLKENTVDAWIQMDINESGDIKGTILSYAKTGEPVIHSTSLINYVTEEAKQEIYEFSYEEIQEKCRQKITRHDCYQLFSSIQIEYQEGFQVIDEVLLGEGIAFAKLSLLESLAEEMMSYTLHPALCDGAMQTALVYMSRAVAEGKTYVPAGLEEVIVYRPLTRKCYCVVQEEKEFIHKEQKMFHLYLLNEEQQLSVAMLGLTGIEFRGGAGQITAGISDETKGVSND